jgi:hypothetical protein
LGTRLSALCAPASRPIDNRPQATSLPRIAASRKRFWRFSKGVRCWMFQIRNPPKEKRHATVYR